MTTWRNHEKPSRDPELACLHAIIIFSLEEYPDIPAGDPVLPNP
jgi:hypothetical protein